MEKQQILEISRFLSGYLTTLFLYTIKYYFYKKFLGFKSKVWHFTLCALLVTVIDFYMIKSMSLLSSIIINSIIWLLIICFLCNGNFLMKFYAVILEETALLLINLTFLTFDFTILPTIHNINVSFNKHIIISFMTNIINDLIRYTILFVFLKNICKFLNLKEKSIKLYENLFLLIPCLSIYSLGLIFYIIQPIDIDNRRYYLPYIFPKIYYTLPFKKMLEGQLEEKKNLLMEQQFKLQLTHSNNIEMLYKGIRGIIHDMNNHVSCLKNLAATNNIEDIKKYLININETINKLDFKIKTGNSISDAVINEKYNIAKANKIEFICDFLLPKETLLEPVDLCIILSNALDNALEACMRITDSNLPKKICIKSYMKNMYLIIEVSNSATDKIQYAENKIISTKTDKNNHGIGISNIKTVAKKYNGIIDILEEKHKFIINIMLKIK
ncbi:ATP-binding protein [Clostridium botulinum]|uniref:ATP-binding protein n=1 Tax=Clostridium botulinum TaxID=1491 RepID=UPI00016BAD2C|nr:GHKL domain-containing protein [Clostridium botulinum]EDT85921.1 sensor histidine kinase [Clostridium botulinum Bf]NEZ84981.1 ATP-binding protein [Clostridium botulinum]NFE29214.1 ATP-binding protein [Clostridium botulinum]WCJ74362.1 GHKL domain-containing protein [Clostridium botulinum]WCJ78201.1 GHKL domain-containing protein [Clostridium botulinum]